MNEVLVKRIKSLAWRGGMVALAAFIAFVAKNLGDFEMNEQITVLLGLVLGELSKFLNSK